MATDHDATRPRPSGRGPSERDDRVLRAGAGQRRSRRQAASLPPARSRVFYFLPFFWSVSTSFKTLPESVQGFVLIPHHPTLDGYRVAFTTGPFGRYLMNSAIFAITVTLTNLFLCTLGGYAFARLRFPLREPLFMLVLATLMIPDQMRLVPVFKLLTDFPLFHWNLITRPIRATSSSTCSMRRKSPNSS